MLEFIELQNILFNEWLFIIFSENSSYQGPQTRVLEK